MRRALYWQVPLIAGLFATAVFVTGFVTFLRGDVGSPVVPARPAAFTDSAPRSTLAPLILGDSLGRGTGDESGLGIGGRLGNLLKNEHRPANPVVNLAVNGAHTADLLELLNSRNVQEIIAQSNPVIISIGGNDLWGEVNDRRRPQLDPRPLLNEVLGRVAAIVGKVRAANPKTRIFVVGLYNPFARTPIGAPLGAAVVEWNAKLAERFATDPNLTIVPTADLFSHRARLSFDNFHPNDEGYALITRRIADSL